MMNKKFPFLRVRLKKKKRERFCFWWWWVFFVFCLFFAWWYSGSGSFGSCGLCFLDSHICYMLILGLRRPSQHFRIFFMYLEPFLDRFCGVTACIVLPGEWVLLHGGQFNYGFYLSKYKSWHGKFPSRALHWKDALCYVLHVVAVLLLLIIFCMVRIKVNFPFFKICCFIHRSIKVDTFCFYLYMTY